MPAKTARVIKYERWLYCLARVYEFSEPVVWGDEHEGGTTSYAIVSVNHWCFDTGGPEAMAWLCDADGNLLPDLDSRTRVSGVESVDHDEAIRALGFEILQPAVDEPRLEPITPEDVAKWNADLEESRKKMSAALKGLVELERELANEAAPMPESVN